MIKVVKKWGFITIGVLLLGVVMAQVFLAGLKYERLDYLRIVDGDTFWVKNARDGSEWRVRLWGVNAPGAKECYFEEATTILEKELANSKVSFEKMGRDDYGRILAKVYVNGLSVEELLVATGAAVAYDAAEVHTNLRPSKDYFDSLKILEEKAKGEKVGVWSDACARI